MTFIATPIIADNLLRIDTRCNCAIFYFPRGEIAIGVRVCCVCASVTPPRGGGEISQRKKGGEWYNASKGRTVALKGDGGVVEKENEHGGRGEGEILYIILPLANSNRGVHEGCGGEEGSETS